MTFAKPADELIEMGIIANFDDDTPIKLPTNPMADLQSEWDEILTKLVAIRSWGEEDEVEHLRARKQEILVELAKLFHDEWTLEITIRRREEWNARVHAGEFYIHGRTSNPLVWKAEKIQGWALTALAKAIKIHESEISH